MARGSPDLFIRGGQTTQHWFRMAAQVLSAATKFAALLFAIFYVGFCATYYEVKYIHVTWAHWWATFFVEAKGEPGKAIRYKHPREGWIEETAAAVYNNPFFVEISETYAAKATQFAYWSMIPALIAAAVAGIVFYIQGRSLDGDEHIRGTQLVTSKELKKWSELKWKSYRKRFGKDVKTGPQYTIAGIKFPPNAVEAQTVISGTVGTGKSNSIKELLATVRANGGRAIIYDKMGGFVRDFYDETTDVIVNPFDARSRVWSPFFEAERAEFFTQVAEVMLPTPPGASDPFWTQAARIVFDYAAQQIWSSGNFSNKALREAILNIPGEELARLIQSTPGRHFLNEEIAKTAGSIRANLISELRFLEFLRDDGEPFSIRKWVKEEQGGFVFLTGDAEHSAATRNIVSTIFEIAANALMTMSESNDPRVWFIMDEVPTLNRMPFLPKSLAEIRQFGGAFVVGYQVYSQLEDIYGDKGAQSIAGNLNNRIVFNTPDHRTADLFSQSLGSEDVEERRESITVGAHEARDGVGFMTQRTERRIVTPSQIQSLPQLEGYVRFAYDEPTAFVRFDLFKVESAQAQKFIPYHGRDFEDGLMNARWNRSGRTGGTSAQSHTAGYQEFVDRLASSGLQFVGEEDERTQEVLREHFERETQKGRRPREIGPPTIASGLMGSGGVEGELPLFNFGGVREQEAPCPALESEDVGNSSTHDRKNTGSKSGATKPSKNTKPKRRPPNRKAPNRKQSNSDVFTAVTRAFEGPGK